MAQVLKKLSDYNLLLDPPCVVVIDGVEYVGY